MKILSVRLRTVVIFAVMIITLTFGFAKASDTFLRTVSSEARMIPIYNVSTEENKAAISFNCAVGNSDIDSILATLDEFNVRATFFLLGSWAEDYPQEVMKIFNAGHEIGNHGYSHNDLPTMSYEDILLDIQKCNEIIKNITGSSPTLFRAPSGAYDNKTISAAENLGMITVQWDVDTLDWKNIPSDEIIARVMTGTEKGSIIQMHTGTEHTSEALNEILEILAEKNLIAVPVGRLILYDNFLIDNNGTQQKISDKIN